MKDSFSRLYLGLVLIILYFPLVFLAVYSFNQAGTMNQFEGWTMEHYINLLADQRLWLFVLNTFIVALIAATIATIIGTFGAIYIHYLKKKNHQSILLQLNNVLLVTPDVLMGASFLVLFSTVIPLTLGFGTVVLAHIAFSVPIVVLIVLPRLKELPDSLIDAALDLGASYPQALWRIVLPSIAKGIRAGFFMALTYSLDDFAVTFFVTGNGFSTLSVEIYSRARQGVSLEINALSTLIFLVTLCLVLGYYFLETSRIKRKEGLIK
ncbi:ABC transporter permease [Dolosicoccus paucivorans]|uniref:ABC transporter permease n=1 Tax=Dolosicoccus paucivorans TaxID=84521 RepID=A0A1G8ILK8_9LACT|nr:ABC transporter permease [Dolosicoccus paucivorans]PMB84928.1 ABC transporter permease [Dolosicoccus paucivorans]PMC58699.1 ABC transporter permease [Dolosicoccus paucivorans]SDI19667.1 spermidine/putrescine transport system permease protein [Dolosicoccus paucivorans]